MAKRDANSYEEVKNRSDLWLGLQDFYLFSPVQQTIIFCLTLLQGVTTGIGLLLILPLLHVLGFDIGVSEQSMLAKSVNSAFELLSIEPNMELILCTYTSIIALFATLKYQLTIRSVKVQQEYITYLRDKLFRSLLNARWSFIVNNKMSDFTHTLSGQVQAVGVASNLAMSLVGQITLALIMIALALMLSWTMTMIVITGAVVLILVLRPLNKLIYGSGIDQLVNYKMIFQSLTEQLTSLKMIKSFGSERHYADRMHSVSCQLETQYLQLNRMNALTQWVYLVSAGILFSLFFYISQTVIEVALSTTLLLLVILARLLPQASAIQRIYQQLLHKLPAFTDIRKMQKKCEFANETHTATNNTMALNNAIRVDNLCYQYPDKAHPVFRNLSFTIGKNTTLALVGPSGAGKSTLADLISGLLVPDQGSIYCDGVELTDSNRITWRKGVAYVTQEVYLFHDTIRANLIWVTTDSFTDDDLWKVLELAAAKDFVEKLPDGLDTVIGDKGVKLSGGERQRLALARALLSKPELLILDEATSALDIKNEQKIKKALDQLHGKLTIVIIAHRETTIEHADKRIVLQSVT